MNTMLNPASSDFSKRWIALKRNLTRSLLTMLGIVWGIATVTLLDRLRQQLPERPGARLRRIRKSVVICWPQQTSEQPGGQRAGKKVVLEQADLDMVKADGSAGEACLP